MKRNSEAMQRKTKLPPAPPLPPSLPPQTMLKPTRHEGGLSEEQAGHGVDDVESQVSETTHRV